MTEYVNSRLHLNSFYCCRVLVESVVSSGNVEYVCGLQGLPGSCGDPHASWTSHQVPAWVSSLVLITKGPSHWRTKQTNGANYGGLIRKLWGNWVMNGNIFVMRWSFVAKINFQKGPLCVFFWSLDLELDDMKENLASLSLSLSISYSLTSGDTKRYWNDYASGLCRYPDVYLMIKRTRRMDLAFFFYPFALSLFFLSYLYIFISPCMARTGHWQGMKAEVRGRVCSLSGKSKSLGWRKR